MQLIENKTQLTLILPVLHFEDYKTVFWRLFQFNTLASIAVEWVHFNKNQMNCGAFSMVTYNEQQFMTFIVFTIYSLLWNVGWLKSPIVLIFCKYLTVWIIGMDFDVVQEGKIKTSKRRGDTLMTIKGEMCKNWTRIIVHPVIIPYLVLCTWKGIFWLSIAKFSLTGLLEPNELLERKTHLAIFQI